MGKRKLSYLEIQEEIQKLPSTWIPALLIEMVKVAIRRHVFKPGRLETFVKNVADDIEKEISAANEGPTP